MAVQFQRGGYRAVSFLTVETKNPSITRLKHLKQVARQEEQIAR